MNLGSGLSVQSYRRILFADRLKLLGQATHGVYGDEMRCDEPRKRSGVGLSGDGMRKEGSEKKGLDEASMIECILFQSFIFFIFL